MHRTVFFGLFIASAGLIISLATTSTATAQKAKAKNEPGGHPLADRTGDLAELLDAPDWPTKTSPAVSRVAEDDLDELSAPREASVPGVAGQPAPERPRVDPRPLARPALPDPTVALKAQELIRTRNAIIDKADFFNTLVKIRNENQVLIRLQWQLLHANRVAQEAHKSYKQVLALKEAGQALVAAAKRRFDDANAKLRNAIVAEQNQRQKLAPLVKKRNDAIGPWLRNYRELRSLHVEDRRDPNRPAILAALEQATTGRHDFYEGHVLAALALVYEGKADAAERHLQAACAGFANFGLFGGDWGADCCQAYLLLEKPEQVKDYVAAIRKLAATRQTPLLCWLVAQAAVLDGKENEAKTYFERSLRAAGFYDKKEPILPEQLVGEAARFYATADKAGDLDKAKTILSRATKGAGHWQYLRGEAAVHEADGDTTAARRSLEGCREQAPQTLVASLSENLASLQ